MNGLDFNNINSASALANAEIAIREIERENARKDAQRNAPIIDGLHGIVSEMQAQNKILAQQGTEYEALKQYWLSPYSDNALLGAINFIDLLWKEYKDNQNNT